jgi:N-hydroxyarylamine O-acetyltransferase
VNTVTAAAEQRALEPDPTWTTEALDLDAYFARIGYEGPRAATVDVLHRVHRGHTSTFPFENIDLLMGVQPQLDLPSVQRKFVTERRGGMCFEQTVLFAAVLEHLGFRVSRMMARPLFGRRQQQGRTHGALVVEAQGSRWLADVGFGGEGLQEAIEIFDGSETSVGPWRWRIERRNELWVLRTMHPDGWFDLYEFVPESCVPADFEVGNFFVARSPRSKLNTFLLVQRGCADIKHFVVGRRLVIVDPAGEQHHQDIEPSEIGALVRETFDLALSDEVAETLANVPPPDERVWD